MSLPLCSWEGALWGMGGSVAPCQQPLVVSAGEGGREPPLLVVLWYEERVCSWTLASCVSEKGHQLRSRQFRSSSSFGHAVPSSLPLDSVIVWAIVEMVVT